MKKRSTLPPIRLASRAHYLGGSRPQSPSRAHGTLSETEQMISRQFLEGGARRRGTFNPGAFGTETPRMADSAHGVNESWGPLPNLGSKDAFPNPSIVHLFESRGWGWPKDRRTYGAAIRSRGQRG